MQTRINFTEYGQQQLALMDPIRGAKLPTFYRSLLSLVRINICAYIKREDIAHISAL